MTASFPCWQTAIAILASLAMLRGAERKKEKPPEPAPVPVYQPAKQPVVTGEFVVGIVNISFKESESPMGLGQVMDALNHVTNAQDGDSSLSGQPSQDRSSGTNQEAYFKLYSNGMAWPKLVMMPDDATWYRDPHFFGYYCEYDYWRNPIGWADREEGDKRVAEMNEEALKFARKSFRGASPRWICYNYLTSRASMPGQELSDLLKHFYDHRDADPDRVRKVRKRKSKKPEGAMGSLFNPWDYYAPACKWGDPMWPNSKIQIHNSAGGVLAHELGHCLGAPDVYRIGRYNDGIGGAAALLCYGPTANAFSRFYHHAYIPAENYPTINKPGTYTLHPRHIKPGAGQAVGYLIPSNHPHYFYHVEYIHQENRSVGVGPDHEGMLISAVNLGRENYTGSPDYSYVYRPHDPFFRGLGDIDQCLFGKRHGRTEFNLHTEPSSRLPNLLDGGVAFSNIHEQGDTLTFELNIAHRRLNRREYEASMLPQIQLDRITDVQPTSFTMDCTIKFRGEPVKTQYGFCWSTDKNPTIRDDHYTLAHRECYRGHATNLKPATLYHVRAFATNGLGYSYSDEEIAVRTAPSTKPPPRIGPLTTDGFSQNPYLFDEFSQETEETHLEFIGYSPTCVLAKLIAYHRPKRFEGNPDADGKEEKIHFDSLNWNPGWDDCPPRQSEINRFFQTVYDRSRALNLHERKPGRDFLRRFVSMTGIRSKPVLSILPEVPSGKVAELIRADLLQSRPVVVVICYDSDEFKYPARWALIEGCDSEGRFLVDFPVNSKLYVDGWKAMKPGAYRLEELVPATHKTLVITSCHY